MSADPRLGSPCLGVEFGIVCVRAEGPYAPGALAPSSRAPALAR
ncbi:hypothetical protein AB0O34_19755 [Sphaerisporangium sp. NPDC088356]